jgi:hypothetical protein
VLGENFCEVNQMPAIPSTVKTFVLPEAYCTNAMLFSWSKDKFTMPTSFVVYYTGNLAQAQTLQSVNTNCWEVSHSTLVSYEEFTSKDFVRDDTVHYMVYNYNKCDAFYQGVHDKQAPYNAFKGDKYISNFCTFEDCSRCPKTIETKLHGPLFISKGYSKSEDAFMFDMKVDFDAIAEYEALGNTVPSYGLVVSGNATISELIGLDGKVVDTSVLKVNFDEGSYNNVQVKLNNILTDTSKAMKVHACTYIIDSESVYYVGEGKATTASTMICYNDIQGEEEVTPEETPAE